MRYLLYPTYAGPLRSKVFVSIWNLNFEPSIISVSFTRLFVWTASLWVCAKNFSTTLQPNAYSCTLSRPTFKSLPTALIFTTERRGATGKKQERWCIVPSLPTPGTTPIPPCDRAGCSEGGGTSSGAASSEGAPLGWVEEGRNGGGEPTSLWETAQLCLQVPRQRWSGRLSTFIYGVVKSVSSVTYRTVPPIM